MIWDSFEKCNQSTLAQISLLSQHDDVAALSLLGKGCLIVECHSFLKHTVGPTQPWQALRCCTKGGQRKQKPETSSSLRTKTIFLD